MDLRILLAPDKFKSTLDSVSVAQAMALGVRDALPDADVRLHPLADGGEGSLDCVAAVHGGSFTAITSEDAFGRAVEARILEAGSTVMIAAHETQQLPPNPTPSASLRASSRGTGLAIVEAARLFPASDVVVWVGGTASTDGGAGAAQAAGWRLVDARGRDLAPGGGALRALASIRPPASPPTVRVTGACDVANPLLGERGAARLFARQKGAGPGEERALEDGLEILGSRIRSDLGIDVSSLRCGGSGGGVGAGLAAFFGASLEDGFARIARETELAASVAWADVVVTGEGLVDTGSLEGKVVAGVARLSADAGKPCLVVAGDVALPAHLLPAERALGATASASLVDHCGRRESFDAPEDCVRAVTAKLVARSVSAG